MNDPHDKDNSEEPEVHQDSLQTALEASDEKQVAEIVDAISGHEALRQVSLMEAGERDDLLTMLAPEAAAELIEEAPSELATSMIEGPSSSSSPSTNSTLAPPSPRRRAIWKARTHLARPLP